MKRTIIVSLLTVLIAVLTFAGGRAETAPAAADPAPAPEEVPGQIGVFVSILPQTYFAERVGGDLIKVEVMVPPGRSPANYEPTPQQVLTLGEADLFFTIGVPFENAFVPTIEKSVPNLRIVSTDAGIEKRLFDRGGAMRPDPHVWMDPILVKEQAAVMRDALIEVDPDFESDYRARYAAFAAELDALDAELRDALAPVSGSSLFVYHPAFGYLLDRYDIEQVAIEIAGREPSPAELEAVIERARNEDARVIFVQPEFPESSARAVAEAINGSVVLVAPLSPDYANNIRSIAEQVRQGLSR